jgi:hypothetical protein
VRETPDYGTRPQVSGNGVKMKHHGLLSIVCGVAFTRACEQPRGISPRLEGARANVLEPSSEESSNVAPSNGVSATVTNTAQLRRELTLPYPHARWRLSITSKLGESRFGFVLLVHARHSTAASLEIETAVTA